MHIETKGYLRRVGMPHVNTTLNTNLMVQSNANTSYSRGMLLFGTDIVSDAKAAIYDLKSEQVKDNSINFLNCLANTVNRYSPYASAGMLPKLKVLETDENSVLFEWVFEDSRFGFRINACDSESYWYWVARKNSIDINMSGDLSNNVMANVLNSVIRCALGEIENVGLSGRVSSRSSQ